MHSVRHSILTFITTRFKTNLQIGVTLKRARLAAIVVCLALMAVVFTAPTGSTSSESSRQSANTNSVIKLLGPGSFGLAVPPSDPCDTPIHRLAPENSR